MTDETSTAAGRRQQWILVLLILVFIAPIALSYFLYHFTSLGQGSGEASHGHLIDPPRQLPDLGLSEIAAGEGGKLHGKWSLVYLVDGRCGETCEQNLYRMRQLRLAQGRDGTRIQRVLINFGNEPVRFSERQQQEYKGQLVARPEQPGALLQQFRLQQGDEPLQAGRLYLVDPRGFLLMSYAPDSDPGGIIDDMKRLLRYSRVG